MLPLTPLAPHPHNLFASGRSFHVVAVSIVELCRVCTPLTAAVRGLGHVELAFLGVGSFRIVLPLVLGDKVWRHFLELHRWCPFYHSKVLKDHGTAVVEGVPGVQVLHRRRCEVELVVGPVVLVVVIERDLVGNGRLVQEHCRFVGPAPCDVADGVPAASQHQGGLAEGFHELDAFTMTVQRQVEAAQAVSCERVCAALENNGSGVEDVHDLLDDGLEDLIVRVVIHAFPQRTVHRVVLPRPHADILEVSGAREEVAVFVEGNCHHSVREVKSLLHAISVVDVNVDVEDSRMVLEELQARDDNVVDVAEPTRFALLGMVQTPAPIDGNVASPGIQLARAVNGCPRVHAAKLVQAVEDRAVRVLTNIELLHLLSKRLVGAGPTAKANLVEEAVGVGSDAAQKVNVLGGVEPGHLLGLCTVGTIDLQLAVETIRQDKVVCQLQTVRLHRVPRAVVVVAHVAIIEIGDLLLLRHARSPQEG
mmetsp:Transcript_5354/g.15736  ORF Transcript_5354/g.15736 Transcript_5354/m.15736 type:complete len:478 (+) Transcript_5354:47-1480(+)